MKKIIFILVNLTFIATFFSCKTTKEIPENSTSIQMIQLGQDAYDRGNYSDAEYYYKETIERYGSDTATYVEALYELGHIYIKTKKYDNAKTCFDEILNVYELDSQNQLPRSYKKLAQIGLSKIPQNNK